VGTVRQPRTGPLRILVTAQSMNALARLLGAPGRTRGLDAPSNLPLNSVALTRHPWGVKRVQPQAACGRWVDFVQPPGRRGRP